MGDESAGTVNRAAENRGEECDVGSEIYKIPARLNPFPMYFDDIADELECESDCELELNCEVELESEPDDCEVDCEVELDWELEFDCEFV